jgi:hypothetical protein
MEERAVEAVRIRLRQGFCVTGRHGYNAFSN